MSDSGQGDGQRSWWEKPDADPAPQDPYRAGGQQGADQDAHDPYRSGPAGGDAPTQGLPHYGQQQESQPQSPYQQPQYGQPQYRDPQQNEQFPATGRYGGGSYGGSYGSGSYGGGYGAQPYNQQYPSYDGPRVTGMAHAVCWTAVGGLVLMGTGLGWIAAIVALALTPGARREILESGGTKRGLGYLLAGKICAWVNIGLTVLAVIGIVVFVLLGVNGVFDSGSSFDGNGTTVSVLLHR